MEREGDRQTETDNESDREREREGERERENQLVRRLLDDAALAATLHGEHSADSFFVRSSPLPNMKRRIASSC